MLKNKLIAGAVFALALFVAGSASAAYMFPNQIDTLQEKKDVQTVLNMSGANLTVDGVFGPMTISAVKTFQGSKNLKVDGKIGPMTRAALEAASAGTAGVTYAPGCSAGTAFSSTTGLACTTVTTGLPQGCTSTAGFSAITGAKCDGSTVVGTDNGPLVGGAGDIILTNTSADVETEVSEGQSDVKVLGFRAEADGSDLQVTNLKVTLDNIGAGSTRLERYMNDVSVWMGSKKVGSANVADFNKDGIVYTKNIALTGAIIRDGQKPYFYVAVSALSNIDSTDLTSEDWRVDAGDLRFTDSTGLVLTDGTNLTATKPDFIDLATSGDVKLNILKGSSNPVAGNVKVSTTGSTSDVLLNQFKLKATGSDMTLSKINVTLTGTGATPAEMASEVKIKVGSDQIAVNDAVLAANGSYAFTLDNDLVIKAGDTVTFDVLAKISKIAVGNFGQGDSLKADYTSSTIEDKNGDAVTNIAGSALGENQTFFSEGVNASNFTSTVATTTNTSGVTTKQTYTASFNLTAFGNTYYIPKGVTKVATLPNDSTNGLSYAVESSAGVATSYDNVAVTSAASAMTSTATTVNNYFELADGDTKTFTVVIEITPGSTPVPGFYHVQLGSVLYDLNQTAVGTDESVYTFAPAQNFETADRSI